MLCNSVYPDVDGHGDGCIDRDLEVRVELGASPRLALEDGRKKDELLKDMARGPSVYAVPIICRM